MDDYANVRGGSRMSHGCASKPDRPRRSLAVALEVKANQRLSGELNVRVPDQFDAGQTGFRAKAAPTEPELAITRRLEPAPRQSPPKRDHRVTEIVPTDKLPGTCIGNRGHLIFPVCASRCDRNAEIRSAQLANVLRSAIGLIGWSRMRRGPGACETQWS